MKLCTRCKVSKPHADFPAKKRARDGKASWCRACFKENRQERYYANHAHYYKRMGRAGINCVMKRHKKYTSI